MSTKEAGNNQGNQAETKLSLLWSSLCQKFSLISLKIQKSSYLIRFFSKARTKIWTHEVNVSSSCDYLLKPTASTGSEIDAELGSLNFNNYNPGYSFIYLWTGNACKTVKELRHLLRGSRHFRVYDVLSIFPVENGVWELVVSDVHNFRRCAQKLSFAVELNGDLRKGFLARLVILWLCSGENPIMQEASGHYYRNLLKRYSFQDIFADMATAFFQLPKSVVMGCLLYRMEGFRYVRDINEQSTLTMRSESNGSL